MFWSKFVTKLINFLAVLKYMFFTFDFKYPQTRSMGLYSGAYGGKKSKVILFSSQYSFTFFVLCQEALSIK